MYHFFLRLPYLIFKFDTALEGSIQYVTQQKVFGNVIWKSVKLHYSFDTKILYF